MLLGNGVECDVQIIGNKLNEKLQNKTIIYAQISVTYAFMGLVFSQYLFDHCGKAWGNTNILLQKDEEITIVGTCYQRVSFKENGKKKELVPEISTKKGQWKYFGSYKIDKKKAANNLRKSK